MAVDNIGKGNPYYTSRLQSQNLAVVVLLANAEQHFTIPAGVTVAVFSATSNFFVLVNNQTAAVPAATNVAFPSPNTVPELNPSALNVVAGNVMSLISSTGCTVTISFYRDSDLS